MKLVWSNLARGEMQALRRYAVTRWGKAAARRYLEDVRDAVTLVGMEPGRARKLKGAYRIFRIRSHCLILHVDENARLVTVARVLHGAIDIERHLP